MMKKTKAIYFLKTLILSGSCFPVTAVAIAASGAAFTES